MILAHGMRLWAPIRWLTVQGLGFRVYELMGDSCVEVFFWVGALRASHFWRITHSMFVAYALDSRLETLNLKPKTLNPKPLNPEPET